MRRLRLVPSAAALLLVGAVGLGACASDSDIEQARFATDLQARTGISEDEATCLTDKIYAEFEQAEVNRIYHAATEAEVGGDTLEVLDRFNAECITGAAGNEADAPPAEEGDGGDDTTTTEADATTTTAEG